MAAKRLRLTMAVIEIAISIDDGTHLYAVQPKQVKFSTVPDLVQWASTLQQALDQESAALNQAEAQAKAEALRQAAEEQRPLNRAERRAAKKKGNGLLNAVPDSDLADDYPEAPAPLQDG